MGGFGFERGNFTAGFAEFFDFFFGLFVAGGGIVDFFGKAFVLFFELFEAGGLFTVDFGDVLFRVDNG